MLQARASNRSVGWLVAIGLALAFAGAAHASDGSLATLVDEGSAAAVVAEESAPVPPADAVATLPPEGEADPATPDQVVPTPSDDGAAGAEGVVEPVPAAGETIPDETVPDETAPAPELTPAEESPATDPTPPSATTPESVEPVGVVDAADPLPGVVEPPPEIAASPDPAAEVVVETDAGAAGQPQGSRPPSEDRSTEQAAPPAPAESAPVAATSSTPPVAEGIGRASQVDALDLATATADGPLALAVSGTSQTTTLVVDLLAAIGQPQAVSLAAGGGSTGLSAPSSSAKQSPARSARGVDGLVKKTGVSRHAEGRESRHTPASPAPVTPAPAPASAPPGSGVSPTSPSFVMGVLGALMGLLALAAPGLARVARLSVAPGRPISVSLVLERPG